MSELNCLLLLCFPQILHISTESSSQSSFLSWHRCSQNLCIVMKSNATNVKCTLEMNLTLEIWIFLCREKKTTYRPQPEFPRLSDSTLTATILLWECHWNKHSDSAFLSFTSNGRLHLPNCPSARSSARLVSSVWWRQNPAHLTLRLTVGSLIRCGGRTSSAVFRSHEQICFASFCVRNSLRMRCFTEVSKSSWGHDVTVHFTTWVMFSAQFVK